MDKLKLKAEHFDILGLFTFTFLAGVSFWAIATGESLPEWAIFVILIIGILGIIIDGTIVYKTFIRK